MRKRIEWYRVVLKHKAQVGLPMLRLVFRYVLGRDDASMIMIRQGNIGPIAACLMIAWRAIVHDLSKFKKDEAMWFIATMDDMKNAKFGTEAYKRCCEIIKPGIDLHYKRNRHHPQHHARGVLDMSDLDKLEMFFDWEAASRRNGDDGGNSYQSVELCAKRYHLDWQDKIWAHDVARFIDQERWERGKQEAKPE